MYFLDEGLFVNNKAISTPPALHSFWSTNINFDPRCGLFMSKEAHMLHSIKFGKSDF